MKLVLSDMDLQENVFSNIVQVVRIGIGDLAKYEDNPDVAVIVGSRAMANAASKVNLPGLKLVQLTSAGFDGVPIEQYQGKRIPVANAGSVYSAPIAETVILSMLLMAKRLHKNPNNRHVKLQRHYEATITEIVGKRILILGTGSIGTAISSRLQGFEAVVDGYNRSGKERPGFTKILSGKQDLKDHIGEYDYIISTLPDSEETKGWFNKELLDRMSKEAVLVNVGRNAVFNEKDLYLALKRHRINGAVLDIFEKLPNPITNRFRRLSNVIVLPGVSAVSGEVKARLKDQISRNVLAAIHGDTIANSINGVR